MKYWLTKFFKILPQNLFGTFVTEKNNKIIIISEEREYTKKHIFIKGLKVYFEGKNNILKIYMPCNFENSKIVFAGNGSECILKKCRLINAEIYENEQAYFSIDENSSVNGLFMLVNEKKSSISIGKDCMFSGKISFWPTDGHCISDKHGKCLNKASKGINIGNHVWIGYGCSIMKNVSIADNCVIGCSSVVTHSFNMQGSVIAGNPAKIVKTNIIWKRSPPE